MPVQEERITVVREEGDRVTIQVAEPVVQTTSEDLAHHLTVSDTVQQVTVGQETDTVIISTPGVQGAVGPAGPPGPPGPIGGPGGQYVHDQGAHGGPASVWTVEHDLGFQPGGILVEDTAGQHWDGQVEHLSNSVLTITFNAPMSGYAFIS